MLINSCIINTGLHKHHFYFYRTDFAMKRGHGECATTSLNAVKIACNSSGYDSWLDHFVNGNKTAKKKKKKKKKKKTGKRLQIRAFS